MIRRDVRSVTLTREECKGEVARRMFAGYSRTTHNRRALVTSCLPAPLWLFGFMSRLCHNSNDRLKKVWRGEVFYVNRFTQHTNLGGFYVVKKSHFTMLIKLVKMPFIVKEKTAVFLRFFVSPRNR